MTTTIPSSSTPTPDTSTRSAEFYRAADYVPEESVGYLMRRVLALVAQDVERELEA